MYKLVVLYPHPDDPAAFMKYYTSRHLPLASKLPGLVGACHAQPLTLGPDTAAYFLVFEAMFKDEAALFEALGSPAGQAVVADVPNYSPKGATLLRYEIKEL